MASGTFRTLPAIMEPVPILSRANAPFIALVVLAGGALVWFLAVGGLDEDPGVVGPTSTLAGTTVAPSTTAAAGDGTTAESGATTSTSGADDTSPAPGLPAAIAVDVITDQLAQPVFATAAPGDDRIFVVERQGRIRVVDPQTRIVGGTPFLDVSSKTLADKGIELGLLGLAFHPGYEENGRFFVYYTDTNHDTAVAEYARLDADRADPASERIFVRVEREGLRHNAGMLQFGPDGNLWIAIGDGGLFEVYGQDPTQFLGTILRLDVDGEEPYAIPPDNPFVDGGGAPEVWAYGLRNPWRFDIDSEAGLIYIGDVGQADAEEIDAVPLTPSGWNFGWPIMEGPNCWLEVDCDTAGLTLPITSYSHAEGCSVTGGVVYRGAAIPGLVGHYLYADWCLGWIRSLRYDGSTVHDMADWSSSIGEVGMITSFGTDADGEVLIVTQEGMLGRIVEPG